MAKGPWRDAVDRLLGRSDVQEEGVGRGNYSSNDGHGGGHTYNDIGITARQEEVILTYIQEGSLSRAAHELDMHKGSVHNALNAIKEKFGVETTADAVEMYQRLRYPERYSDQGEQAWPTQDTDQYHPSWGGFWDRFTGNENRDNQAIEGGDHPWMYDSEGNRID